MLQLIYLLIFYKLIKYYSPNKTCGLFQTLEIYMVDIFSIIVLYSYDLLKPL